MTRPVHVVVTSEQSLVADAVCAALRDGDLEVSRLTWPSRDSGQVPRPRRTSPYDAGVLLTDLASLVQVADAQRVVGVERTSWLVLTSAPRGPLWGAMLEAGAVGVRPDSLPLTDLRVLVRSVAAGGEVTPRAELDELSRAWRQVGRHPRDLAGNIRALSPREAEVLELMRRGDSVGAIAAELGVSESTVRSQVRAVLRKLDVRSQLEAVAAYESASTETAWGASD